MMKPLTIVLVIALLSGFSILITATRAETELHLSAAEAPDSGDSTPLHGHLPPPRRGSRASNKSRHAVPVSTRSTSCSVLRMPILPGTIRSA